MRRMQGIGIVLNPKSRRNLRNPKAATRLAHRLGDHGVVREAHSIDELHRIAEDFKRLNIQVLGISGGDGTNHVTLTGFINVYQGMALPQIALLRGGTMNTIANSVGTGAGRPEGLLARLVRAYNERATRPLENVERNVMKIGDQYGFLFGTGVMCGFLREYYRSPEPSPAVAAQTLLRGVGSALVGGETIRRMSARWRGSVSFNDGNEWGVREYFAITAGTIDHIGLNFRPYYRFKDEPGKFQMLGVHGTTMQVVRNLGRVWAAKPMQEHVAYDVLTSKAVLRSADPTQQFFIDGDLVEAPRELEVAMGPKVRIVVIP